MIFPHPCMGDNGQKDEGHFFGITWHAVNTKQLKCTNRSTELEHNDRQK